MTAEHGKPNSQPTVATKRTEGIRVDVSEERIDGKRWVKSRFVRTDPETGLPIIDPKTGEIKRGIDTTKEHIPF